MTHHTQPNGAPLTPREQEVLTLVFRGMTRDDLADRFGVARRTVDVRLCGIYDKLGVRTRLQALGEASRRGLLPSA